ncbi:MAG: hypothetical protein V4714_20735 [Bacteroidota bacterium]
MIRSLILLCFFIGSLQLASGQILQTEPGKEDTVSIEAQKPISPFFKPQKYLVFDKPGKVKRVRFFVGNEITFLLKGDNVVYQEAITAIDDSSFTIFGTKVLIREVDRVILRTNNFFINVGSRYLPAAGIIYFLADNLNPVFQGSSFKVSPTSAIIGASLVTVGIVLKQFQKRRHKIGKNKRLRILETF